MASPQLENGFLRISTELFDALLKVRVPGEARQVLDVIIRKTYGYNKKEDDIALSQFVEITGMAKRGVIRAIQMLQKMNLIVRTSNRYTHTFSLNKDFDTWKPLLKVPRGVKKAVEGVKKAQVSKKTSPGVKKAYEKGVKKAPTIDKINTITKDNSADAREKPKFSVLGADVLKLFEAVDPKNRTYYQNTTQRAAAEFLIDTYGFEQVKKVIAYLPKSNKQPYLPKINSPNDLKEKWVKLQDMLIAKKAEATKKSEPNYVL